MADNVYYTLRLGHGVEPHALVARRDTDLIEAYVPWLGWAGVDIDPDRLTDREIATPITPDEADQLTEEGFGPNLDVTELAVLEPETATIAA